MSRQEIGAAAALTSLAAAPRALRRATTPTSGALHEHSGYSDGWPGSPPGDLLRLGQGGSASTSWAAPSTPTTPTCRSSRASTASTRWSRRSARSPTRSTRSTRSANGTRRSSRRAPPPRPNFTAFRGFEWTSDRFGHINVYFSRHDANAKADGGYATMDALLLVAHARARARRRLATGSRSSTTPGEVARRPRPGFNWNDFAYVPAADDRMVGIEVFNDNDDFGQRATPSALDKGWHVGAIGAEDLGHRRTDDWGGPGWAKTVILANGRSEARSRRRCGRGASTRSARPACASTSRSTGGRWARASRPPRARSCWCEASVNDPTAKLELVTSFGEVVASGTKQPFADAARRRAPSAGTSCAPRARGKPIAYSSPVWVATRQRPGADGGEWLAGDLHVHTCFSHDAYCPPNDDNTGPDEFYTFGMSPGARFLEASARGLDYLAITDHNDVRSAADPDFGSYGVIGLPATRTRCAATRRCCARRASTTRATARAGRRERDGECAARRRRRVPDQPPRGRHRPSPSTTAPTPACSTGRYGYDVRPDTIEVLEPDQRRSSSPRPTGSAGSSAATTSARPAAATRTGSRPPPCRASATRRPGCSRATARAPAIAEAIREGRTTISASRRRTRARSCSSRPTATATGLFEAEVGDRVRAGAR